MIDIPEDLKDPDFDAKHDTEEPKLRTAELFRLCVGRVFTVFGFGRHGHVELRVGNSPAVRKAGMSGWIWIEPEFLKLVRRKSPPSRTRG